MLKWPQIRNWIFQNKLAAVLGWVFILALVILTIRLIVS